MSGINLLLTQLLATWSAELQLWALNGSLVSAAVETLALEEADAELTELIDLLASGNFAMLPKVELLEADAIAGVRAAYVTSNGTIYLNADWLAGVSIDEALVVLTEEFGHHLDSLFNSVDTAGDEGELFAARLTGASLDSIELERLAEENDQLLITVGSQLLEAEASGSDTQAPILMGLS